jgi:hypothetical protein
LSHQDLKFFNLDNASLGIQEVFKTAPKAVKIPTELLDWVRAVLWEYLHGKKDDSIHDIMIAIRTKAIDNGYSSQQVMETIERVTRENNNRVDDRKINKRYQKLTN